MEYLPDFELELSKVEAEEPSYIKNNVAGDQALWKEKKGSETIYQAFIENDSKKIDEFIDQGVELISIRDIYQNTVLHVATAYGYLDSMEKLLKIGISPNVINHYNHTPLEIASYANNFQAAQLLLKYGAAVTTLNREKNTALHLAAFHNNPKLINLLLSYGSNCYANNKHYRVPLHIAVEHGQLEVVQILLKKPLLYDKRDLEGNTPLHLAAYYGYEALVDLFLTYPININAWNKKKNSPLHMAAYQGHLQIARKLIHRGADIEMADAKGRTTLHIAVYKNQLSIMDLLLEKGVKLNKKTKKEGDTPLHVAIILGHKEAIEILSQFPRVLTIKNRYNFNALHLAVLTKNINLVQFILKKVKKLELIDKAQERKNNTILHMAAYSNSPQIVTLLLQKGADINAKTEYIKETALHIATRIGSFLITQLLVLQGADLEALTIDNETPFLIAVNEGHLDTVRYLLTRGANLHAINRLGATALHIAAYKGHLSIIEFLIKKGIFIDIPTDNDRKETALHIATQKGDWNVVNFLLNAGADIHAKTDYDDTVLHMASYYGYQNLVALFLKKGVASELHLKGSGSTPLHLAAQEGHVKIVSLLLKHNAQPNINNFLKNTPLHLAVFHQHLKIVQLLIETKTSLNMMNKVKQTPLHLGIQLSLDYKAQKTWDITTLLMIMHYENLKRLTYHSNELSNFSQINSSYKERIYGNLIEYFCYQTVHKQVSQRLGFQAAHLSVLQKAATDIWLRFNAHERGQLFALANYKLQRPIASPISKPQPTWQGFPVEIKQQILYYAYQKRLSQSRRFQCYRSAEIWTAGMGVLLGKLSLFSRESLQNYQVNGQSFEGEPSNFQNNDDLIKEANQAASRVMHFYFK